VLKAALTGTTLDNDMNNQLIYAANIRDFSATRLALGSVSGSQTINYALGHFQTLTTTGSVSLAFQLSCRRNCRCSNVSVTVSSGPYLDFASQQFRSTTQAYKV
jgi:hypothetical protein